jgi:hypothetical protein
MAAKVRSARLAVRAAAALLGALLAGCGGTGGQNGAALPSGSSGSNTTASITLDIPPSTTQSIAKKIDYVSPNTASIQIVVKNVNGSPTLPPNVPASTTVQLSDGPGGNCSPPAPPVDESCSVTIPAPAGEVVYQFTIFDSKGDALASATKQFKIVLGEANTNLTVVLGGIVAAMGILVPVITSGVPSQGALLLTPLDASGAQIDASAPYATPVIISDTDTSGDTSLGLNGGHGSQSVQVIGANVTVTFSYNGNPLVPPFDINATVNGVQVGSSGTIIPSTQAISFTNTYLDLNTDPKGPSYGQPTMFFSTVGTPSSPVTQQTTASESGYNGTFTARIQSNACISSYNGGQVASLTGSPGTTFTVSSLNPGFCEIVVADSGTHSSIFWVSVTTGVVNINSRWHHVVK